MDTSASLLERPPPTEDRALQADGIEPRGYSKNGANDRDKPSG
jgi:hypothetical protein